MRRDPVPSEGEGDGDPLDAALGELEDLAELEQRFAVLDARLVDRRRDGAAAATEPDDDDDPFADIARALREQRALLDADRAGQQETDPPGEDSDELQLELSIDDDDAEDEDSACASTSEDDPVAVEIEVRCQDALDALEDGDLAQAREVALAAVRLDDEHPFPIFVLGLVAEREGDLDTARDMAELSLRTAGTNPDAIGLRAHIHVRQHELAKAEELLRFGIAHNPDEAMLHEGLARVALARGEHAAALQAAATALRIEPGNAGALAVRTAALDEGADRGALLAALRQGVQLHPEDPYGMVELASIEMEHGNLERARALLMRAQRLAPRDPEIGSVRALVEHVHERPLLRPVPALLRWIRDFPGGLPGFLVGFVVAALPLHVLAANPEYRLAAWTVIATWGAVALYAWIAPAVLTHRLNERAARGGAERLSEQMRDPLAPLPPIDRIADVVSMLVTAHDRRGAADLVALAARRAASQGERPLLANSAHAAQVAPPLEVLAARLRAPRARIGAALLAVPAADRALVACAVAVAVAAPLLADLAHVPLLLVHGAAAACMTAAWLLVLVGHAATRDVDDAFTAIQLAATAAADADADRGR